MNYAKPVAIAATAVTMAATSAQAGGMAEPVMAMEPEMVTVAPASSSSAEIIIPLIILALIAAAMSGGSDSVVTEMGAPVMIR